MDALVRDTQLAIIEKCKELGASPGLAVHLVGGLGHVLTQGALKLGWEPDPESLAELVSNIQAAPAPPSPEN